MMSIFNFLLKLTNKRCLDSLLKSTKAQTISADALVAVALFTVVIIFFFAISTSDSGERISQDLRAESTKLISALSGSRNTSSAFVIGSKINIERLESVSRLSYPELKSLLGIRADFCIHFEDRAGNVINITGNKTGLGSAFIVVGGVNCG